MSRHGKGKLCFLEGGVEGSAEERDKADLGEKCRSGTDHILNLFRNHSRCVSSFFGKCNFSSVTCLVVCARAAVCSCQAQENLLLYETSNGAKRRILIEMTVNSFISPEVSYVDCSHHGIIEAQNNLGLQRP